MKNKESLQQFLQQLRQSSNREDLVLNEEAILAVNQDAQAVNSNIIIKVLIAFGGVLGTVVFVAFLLTAGLYDSEVSMLVLGLLFILSSVLLHKIKGQIFFETIGVTTFLSGFILTGFGMGLILKSDEVICLLFILIAMLSMIWVQKYVHIFISVLIINGSILALMMMRNSFELMHVFNIIITYFITYAFLNEARLIIRYRKYAHFYNPILSALVITFFTGSLFISKQGYIAVSPQFIWISSIAVLIALYFVLKRLILILDVKNKQYQALIFIISYLTLLPTSFFPAIAGSVLILLLSFIINWKVFFALSVGVLIYSVSQFYYDLSLTLLFKSLLMMITGLLFILLYFFAQKKLNKNERTQMDNHIA